MNIAYWMNIMHLYESTFLKAIGFAHNLDLFNHIFKTYKTDHLTIIIYYTFVHTILRSPNASDTLENTLDPIHGNEDFPRATGCDTFIVTHVFTHSSNFQASRPIRTNTGLLQHLAM
jgi:hypothetical protein